MKPIDAMKIDFVNSNEKQTMLIDIIHSEKLVRVPKKYFYNVLHPRFYRKIFSRFRDLASQLSKPLADTLSWLEIHLQRNLSRAL
jgi:hypothetical protein